MQGLPLALLAPLPPGEAVAIGLQACRALAAAHDLGLVHAGEILVRQDGVPKLSGFRPGAPGDDVRALAQALNEVSPGLPPLGAATETGLARELERARATTTAPTAPLPAPATPSRRRLPLAPTLAVAAVAAVAIGLAAAFATGGGPPEKTRTTTVVQPVPHGATAEQQARNLSAWLARYSR